MNTHLTLHHDETIHDDLDYNSGPRFATAWTLRATGEKFKVSSVNQPHTEETMIFPHRDDHESTAPWHFCDPDDPWIYFPVAEDKTHRHTVRAHRLFLEDFLANRVDT